MSSQTLRHSPNAILSKVTTPYGVTYYVHSTAKNGKRAKTLYAGKDEYQASRTYEEYA